MPEKDYTQFLTDKDRLRIHLVTKHGKIVLFIVQYYAQIESGWKTIIRVDNYHGYPHKHTYYLHKKPYTVKLDTDENKVFNESKDYIKDYFKSIKENYLSK